MMSNPHIKHGLISGALMGVILFISFAMAPAIPPSNIEDVSFGSDGIWKIIQFFLPIVAMVLAVRETREKLLGGYISFAKGFSTAYKTGLVIMGVYVLAMIIYFYAVDPNWFPLPFEQLYEYIEENDTSGADLEEMKGVFETVYDNISLIWISVWVIQNLIAFAIVGLVVGGIFTKEDKSEINL